MTGALINALGIVVGGALGLAAFKPKKLAAAFPPSMLKNILGLCTVVLGIRLAWVSCHGRFGQILGKLGILMLALALGKLAGRALRLQKLSNAVGRRASQTLAAAPNTPNRINDGFLMATGLFCVGPLALLASVDEGLNGLSKVFMVKAGIDGLATYAFCETFGWGVILSAIPVLALESALTRGAQCLEPFLRHQSRPLIDAVNVVDGLLIFSVAMLILGLKKIEVADYFPSLALAPLLTWWLWR